MELWHTFFSNPILNRAMAVWLVSQTSKFAVSYFKAGTLNWERFVGAGGMPSAHSAVVSCLLAGVIRYTGFGSPLTAVTFVFAMIVMYDATGVRQAAGKQAEVLNKIIEEFRLHKQVTEIPLKELLGHTPIEVIVGAALGILFALWP